MSPGTLRVQVSVATSRVFPMVIAGLSAFASWPDIASMSTSTKLPPSGPGPAFWEAVHATINTLMPSAVPRVASTNLVRFKEQTLPDDAAADLFYRRISDDFNGRAIVDED